MLSVKSIACHFELKLWIQGPKTLSLHKIHILENPVFPKEDLKMKIHPQSQHAAYHICQSVHGPPSGSPDQYFPLP